MVISPQKGKSRRMRVNREERGPFSVGFSPDRPNFGRSIFYYNKKLFSTITFHRLDTLLCTNQIDLKTLIDIDRPT